MFKLFKEEKCTKCEVSEPESVFDHKYYQNSLDELEKEMRALYNYLELDQYDLVPKKKEATEGS